MKISSDRILTTHTGSLPRPAEIEDLLVAIDRDPAAVASGSRHFAGEMRLALVHASFADLGALVPAYSDGRACRGVLFDLGVSSPQLDDPHRGFSFRADGQLLAEHKSFLWDMPAAKVDKVAAADAGATGAGAGAAAAGAGAGSSAFRSSSIDCPFAAI